MKDFWFQKRGRNMYTPVNWKGWALFSFVIGLVVSTTHWSSNPLIVGVSAAIIAALGYWLMDLKRAPDSEVIGSEGGKKFGTIRGGSALGLIGSLAVFVAIMAITSSMNPDKNQPINSTTGTATQPNNDATVVSNENGTTPKNPLPPAPDNATKPAATTDPNSIPADSGYLTYKNSTMYINSLLYPKTWTASDSSDKLSVTFEAPDKHVDVTATLYGGDTSYDLQSLFLQIQQGTQQNGVQITQHQTTTIGGKEWLTYDYELRTNSQTYDERGAVYILPGNNQKQFMKVQLESNAGYFSTDLPMFNKMLASLSLVS